MKNSALIFLLLLFFMLSCKKERTPFSKNNEGFVIIHEIEIVDYNRRIQNYFSQNSKSKLLSFLDLMEKKSHQKRILKFYNKAYLFLLENEIDSSYKYVFKANAILKDSDPFKVLTLAFLSRLSFKRGNLEYSYDYALRSYKLSKQFSYNIQILGYRCYIASCLDNHKLNEAHKKILDCAKILKKPNVLNENLASYYTLLSKFHKLEANDFLEKKDSVNEKKELYKSYKFIQKALLYCSTYPMQKIEILGHKAYLEDKLEQKAKAKETSKESYELNKSKNFINPTVSIHYAKYLILNREYSKANSILNEIFALIKSNDFATKKYFYSTLYDLEYNRQHYKDAAEAAQLVTKNSNLLINDNVKYAIAEVDAKLKIKEILNEKRINEEISKKNKQILHFFILFLIVIILFVFFLYLSFKKRKENELIITEINLKNRLFTAQLNPHFIFNTLALIHVLIATEKNNLASTYIKKFSHLLRKILENSESNLISLADELATLKNYLEIQQLRFDNPFNFSIDIDKNINTEELMIPPMLLQPFVENSIVHGFDETVKNGQLQITIMKQAKNKKHFLSIQIKDNGIGIQQDQKKKYKSMSTKLTRDRLDLLKKIYKFNAEVKIVDNASSKIQEKGVHVQLCLPLITFEKKDEL